MEQKTSVEEKPKVEEKEKEKSKKENKPKKEKKKIIPFDKIDITTATEDEIIRSGIKHNTKKDVTCYMIMCGIFVLAILPVALRIIVPRKKTTAVEDISYFTMTCYKTIIRDDYELSTKILSNYRDGTVTNVTIDFNYFKRNENAKDGYVFTEINELEQLDLQGFTSNTSAGKAKFEINFEDYPSLMSNEALKDYSLYQTAEVNHLSNEKGFSCSTENETKTEVIDIETRKKVE